MRKQIELKALSDRFYGTSFNPPQIIWKASILHARLNGCNKSPSDMFNLGVQYEHGQAVSQDYAKAREWYQKAAGEFLV